MSAPVRLPLASKAEHSSVLAEWEEFFASSVQRLNPRRKWIDWINTAYENCVPNDDSLTILSKKCETEQLGFSVHLHLPDSGAPEVGSYWRVFGEGVLDRPIRHFVISAIADPKNVAEAREILVLWLEENAKTA
jgi:hypothetical protein